LRCENFANSGKEVIIAGLDGDYKRQTFGKIAELLPLADETKKWLANCDGCDKIKGAAFSFLKINATEQIVIGKEHYMALCRSCYFKETERKDSDEKLGDQKKALFSTDHVLPNEVSVLDSTEIKLLVQQSAIVEDFQSMS
jgi:hypothetical protein